jgi:hypothetical protein
MKKAAPWILTAAALAIMAWALMRHTPAPVMDHREIRAAERKIDSLQLQIYLHQDSTALALQQRAQLQVVVARQKQDILNLKKQNEKNSDSLRALPADGLLLFVSGWLDSAAHSRR